MKLFSLIAATCASAVSALAASDARSLTNEDVLADVTRELVSHYSLEGELQLEFLRAFPSPPSTATKWEVRIVDFPTVASSNLLLRCQFIGDGYSRGEATLMIRAYLWRDSWSTRQNIATGATFDPTQLNTQRVDIFRERDALPVNLVDTNQIFSRTVAANRVITWRDVARRPLVRKGDLVEVTASNGALSVTLQAQALENGAAGDAVTVRNTESKKTFSAIVTDEKRAQLRL